MLVAAPPRILLGPFTAALIALGAHSVLQLRSVEAVDQIIASRTVGNLALISAAFGASTPRLIRDLRRAGWPRVVALLPTDDPEPIITAVHAGATGVLRHQPISAETGEPPPLPAGVGKLSPREINTIRLAADGLANAEIGRQLNVSRLSVKSQFSRIARKLDTGERANIVAIALPAGIIE